MEEHTTPASVLMTEQMVVTSTSLPSLLATFTPITTGQELEKCRRWEYANITWLCIFRHSVPA